MNNKKKSQLNLLKAKFKKGDISKMDYRDCMYDFHKILFDYSEFIKDTDIKKIEIIDNNVIMTSREHGIKIACMKGDVRIAPIETLSSDYYEKNDTRMLYNLIENNSTVFDIGANIGWYSIGISTHKKNTNVYSFEPIPKVFENLKLNLKLNKSTQIKLFNYGFYNKKKTLTFYYYPDASGYSSNVPIVFNDVYISDRSAIPQERKSGNPVEEYSLINAKFVKSSEPTLIALISKSINKSKSDFEDGEDKKIIFS